jgi:transposase
MPLKFARQLGIGSQRKRIKMENRLKRLSVAVANFSSLEERLIECLDFLQYTEENHNIVSPRFVPIILDACSLIDSILKAFVGKHEKKSNLKYYSQNTERYLELDSAFSIFLNTQLEFLNPFSSWQSKVPHWWSAYNHLKHDRLNNYSEATYENTVLSLCALHQVISRNREFIPNLISAGWFNSQSPDFSELVMAQYIQVGVKPIHVMPVETRLFVTPLHSNFVEFKSGEPVLLEGCQFSPRVDAMICAIDCINAGEFM